MSDQGNEVKFLDLDLPPDPAAQTPLLRRISNALPAEADIDIQPLTISTAEHPDDRAHRLGQDKKVSDWELTKAKALFCVGLSVMVVFVLAAATLLAVETLTEHKLDADFRKALYAILIGIAGTFIGYVAKK